MNFKKIFTITLILIFIGLIGTFPPPFEVFFEAYDKFRLEASLSCSLEKLGRDDTESLSGEAASASSFSRWILRGVIEGAKIFLPMFIA